MGVNKHDRLSNLTSDTPTAVAHPTITVIGVFNNDHKSNTIISETFPSPIAVIHT
jgi:hypothetical protein